MSIPFNASKNNIVSNYKRFAFKPKNEKIKAHLVINGFIQLGRSIFLFIKTCLYGY